MFSHTESNHGIPYHLCLLFPLWSCRDYPYVMQSILVHYLILGITSYSKVMKIMRCNICVVFLNLDCWGKPPFNWEKLWHLLEIVKSCIIWYIMQHGLKIFIATILSFEFKIPNDLINKFSFQWTSLYYCSLSISFITFWKFSLCEKHIFTNRNSVLYRSPTDPRKTWYNALYVQYD